MKINCLSCGHTIDIGDAYDTYKGSVRCFVCRALLEIRTVDGALKSANLLPADQHPPAEGTIERISDTG